MNETEASYLSETYKQKTHRDQILDAPDSYIGSIQLIEQPTWAVSDLPTAESPQPPIDQFLISYHPGLYKLVDETIVNCRDQYIRMVQSPLSDKKPVTYIHVTTDTSTGQITMENDGDGIDIAQHPDTQKWIPEMIFTNLLTSTNYNKNEKRITGGKNGLGIKLVIIWSSYARIETVDHRRQLRYVQEIYNNMSDVRPPIITKVSKTTKPMTKIAFIPDYARLGIPEGLSRDMERVIAKRTIDICGTTELTGKKLNVKWNNILIPIHKFQSYIQLYPVADVDSMKYEKSGERWEYAVTLSPDNSFRQISFVNGIATFRGGRHVDYIVNQITDKLCEAAEKKKINTKNGPSSKYPDSNSRFVSMLKRLMSVFVRCDIENPSFDSQTKEYLTTQISQFGSSCVVSAGFITKMLALGFLERIQQLSDATEQKEHKKTDGVKRKNIMVDKLDDANLAGTARSAECTLIICEGDSAKNGLKSGLSAADRNIYGLFPVGGKMLNVLNVSNEAILKNKEIQDLKQILGLETGRTYTAESARRLLRYGKVMIAADQDLDGSHIKGLGVNIFMTLWPSLAEINGFLSYLNTPILKATGKGGQVRAFYHDGEFRQWREKIAENVFKQWSLKYYKGLGTSTRKEFQEYMNNPKIVDFQMTPACKNTIQMVFHKSRVPERKAWMKAYNKDVYLDTSCKQVAYADFINKDLIHFSIYSCDRAIPNVMDGLKTGQRKIICTELARPQTSEIKVIQLAGRVSETMDYLHGEDSLTGTIKGAAQTHVGSNNIAYLQAIGQFGTRIQNGSDAASPRYIYTKLEPITKHIFSEADSPILTYLYDGNTRIEPEYYYPILPMALINGCAGIGTGFSTTIPSYSPLDIMHAIRARLRHGLISELTHRVFIPYYEQFKGRVEAIASGNNTSFQIRGVYHRKSPTSPIVCITELPVGTSTESYEKTVKQWVDDSSVPIVDHVKNNTDLSVYFELTFASADHVSTLEAEVDANGVNKLEHFLKLVSIVHTSNMYLFDPLRKLTLYASPDEIIDAYFPARLDAYARRRVYHLKQFEKQARRLDNKVRYIQGTLAGTIDLRRKSDDEISHMLKAHHLDLEDDTYQYLIGMPMNAVSEVKVASIQKEYEAARAAYDLLQHKTPADLWEEDIGQFEIAYREYKKNRELPYLEEASACVIKTDAAAAAKQKRKMTKSK